MQEAKELLDAARAMIEVADWPILEDGEAGVHIETRAVERLERAVKAAEAAKEQHRFGWAAVIRTEENGVMNGDCTDWVTGVYPSREEAQEAALEELRKYFEENTILSQDEEGYGQLVPDGDDRYLIQVGSYDIVFDGFVRVELDNVFA